MRGLFPRVLGLVLHGSCDIPLGVSKLDEPADAVDVELGKHDRAAVRVDRLRDGVHVLDADRLNNHWTAEPDPLASLSWAARVLVMLQSLFLGTRGLS